MTTNTKPEKIRIADRRDEEDLMALCRELWLENAMYAVNESKVRDMLYRAFDRRGGLIGVIGEPGKIEGAIYLLVTSFWYTDETQLEELFSFVLPEYRRSTNAKDLISFAKWCSDESGFPLVIGIVSNIRTESKVKLYQRQLDKPVGAYFMHLPKNNNKQTLQVAAE